jgi:hypothetical protein
MSVVTSLSRVDPAVDPGGQVAVTVKIRNAGSIVDRFDVDVVGPSTGWARVDPPSLSLFPGVEGTVTVTFAPPRAPTPRAGIYPFGIRVRPAADPAGSNVEEGKVTVTPFTSVTAEVIPQTSRGARVARHSVVVDNRGNAPSEVVVAAIDPDRRLTLGVDPVRSVVAPESRVDFRVRVEVDDPFPFGPARPRPFQVSVEPGRQAPIPLRATMSQQPLLPGWIPPVAGVAAVVAVLAIGSFFAKAGPFAPNVTPPPSLVAQASSAPPSQAAPSASTAAASQGTGASAPASGAGGGGPSVSPSPTPFVFKAKNYTLAVTGDNGELGSALSLKCLADDKACRNGLKQDLLSVETALLNQYNGAGILQTTNLGVPNALPLVMTSDVDMPWASQAGQNGTTRTLVVDLGPLLASPPAFPYAIVRGSDGIDHRFVLDSSLAQQLFNNVYALAPGMPTIAPATAPPGTITTPIDIASKWDPNLQFLLQLPQLSPAP